MHLYLISREVLLLKPKHAMLYELECQDVFDLTHSIGIDPV